MTQDTKDLSSYSKEELINLLLQEREQHANTRKHFSNVLNNARKLRMEQIDKATAVKSPIMTCLFSYLVEPFLLS